MKQRKLRSIEMHRMSVEEFQSAAKVPLVVVLDNVRSMHNVGSVFRTADAFRLEGICLCGITGTPPDNELHKTALGAEDSVSWKHYDTALDAVRELKAEGYTVMSIEQVENSTKLQDLHTDEGRRYAIVLGNEVKGVEQDVVDACDGCIEIPQYGTKHSLNVSVAAGIIIWDFARRLLRL